MIDNKALKKFGFILIALLGLFGCEGKWVARNTFLIYSIEKEQSVSGSFFLGSGSINSTMYFFMWRDWDGGMKLVKTEHSVSTIYEDEENFPYVEVWYNGWVEASYKYKIHVPKGTVLKEYHL